MNLVSTMGQPQVETREMGVQYEDSGEQVNLIATGKWTFGEHPIVEAVSTVKTNPAVCIYQLQYVNVTVSGCDCVALEDSGCQIPLISKRLFSWCCNETVGTVTLHGFGKNHTVQAPLVNMTVCLRDAERGDVCEIPIVCAVTDLRAAEYDVILPADVVRELQASSVAVNVSSCDVNAVCDVGTKTTDPEVEYNAPEDVDKLPVSEVEADATDLALEQEQEPCLANCRMPAQAGKGGVLTYKGQTVCQLCVSQGRRAKILRLAHESLFNHVQSCCTCSSRARPVTIDRVPLTQIPRTGEFGRVVTPTPACGSVVVCSPACQSDRSDHRAPEPEQHRDRLRGRNDVADQLIDSPGPCDAAVHYTTTTADFVRRQRRPYCVLPEVVSQSTELLDPCIGRPSDSSGPCDAAVVHRTTTTADFVHRQRRPCHVQSEVDRQSHELLDRDIVRPSDSLTASPIVWVAKEDREGRIACDYRDLNLVYKLFVDFAICLLCSTSNCM